MPSPVSFAVPLAILLIILLVAAGYAIYDGDVRIYEKPATGPANCLSCIDMGDSSSNRCHKCRNLGDYALYRAR